MTGPITLEFLNAAHGDAILVSWGSPPRLAIVDGGPTGSFDRALGPRLAQLREERIPAGAGVPLVLDFVCASHIDDDHIAGIVRLLTQVRRTQKDGLPPLYRIERLWHNSFAEVISAAVQGASVAQIEAQVRGMAVASTVVAASVNQGRDLRDLGRALGLTVNVPFGGPITGELDTTLHGLKVTVVTPGADALKELETTWRATRQRQDPSALAQAFTDDSIPNLSSICSILEGETGRALLTADARGDFVVRGLEALKILPKGGSAHFDVLQVPHHGSANNVTQAFFERVTADHYVISADGIKHAHPSPQTLEWLVHARGNDGYAVHLTNPIPAAMSELQRLGAGRNFIVDARTDPQPGIPVSFGSISA